jgi:Spy/CpxP family protein refolding chaperone
MQKRRVPRKQTNRKERAPDNRDGTNMRRLRRHYAQLLALVLCGVVSVPALVFAHPPGPSPHHGGRLKQLIANLGLDEKTLTEVNQILEVSQTERQELRRQLREAHEHMRTLLEQAEPDEATVMAQADTIGALETEAQKQRLRTILRVRAFLTPAQRAKLLELLRARHPRRAPRPLPPQGEP